LSDFQKKVMAEAGLQEYKIHVKPNFYPGFPPVVPWKDRGDYVVFVGRLSVEKGVSTLIEAWRQWGSDAPQLRIVGDGPLRSSLEKCSAGLPIDFLGKISSEMAQEQIARSRLLVLPSECYEGFPMVVREAFAFGTPVAVSNIGPLSSIVIDGFSGVLFPPSQPNILLEKVQSVFGDSEHLERMSKNSRSEFENKYTEDSNYGKLLNIYSAAIKESKGI